MEKDIKKEIAEELGRKADEIAQTIKETGECLENIEYAAPQTILYMTWQTAKAYGKLEGMKMTVQVFNRVSGEKEE